jgi:hypothetical protein
VNVTHEDAKMLALNLTHLIGRYLRSCGLARISLLVLATLCGCAEMAPVSAPVSDPQCREANSEFWERTGAADGKEGLDSGARLESLRRSCARQDLVPAADAYMKGWNRGVREYCAPDNGYAMAAGGKRINEKVCPDVARGLFLANVNLGRTVHNLRNEIAGAKADARRFEQELKEKLISRDRRRELIDRLRLLGDKLELLEAQLTAAEAMAPIRDFGLP